MQMFLELLKLSLLAQASFGQFRIVAICMGKDLEGKVCMQHVCA